MTNSIKISISHQRVGGFKGERVVVVGKSGFVGSEIMNLLGELGIETFGIGREEIDLVSQKAVHYLARVIRDSDTVVFAAADVPVKTLDQFERNLSMLRHFLEGIKNLRLNHLVYISSDAVFADSTLPLNENSLRGPENLHGLMHLAREVALVKSSQQDVLCIVRPTIIYGANDPHNSYGLCSFMRLAERSEPIFLFGNGEEERDFIHISDVGKIIIEIIKHQSIGALNLVTGTVCSFLEGAKLVREITNSKSQIISKPRVGPMPHNGYRPFSADNLNKAFPLFSAKSLQDGLISMRKGY
jgi:UDP-glucose 4-epimerase